MPQTAVVILNYNGASYLKRFLPEVLKYSGEAEVIVADNASTDETESLMQEQFPEVRFIQNKENTGFAGGYNEVLQKIDATYYLLLNSDVAVKENWLHSLEKCLDENADIAACQPKILSYNNKEYFEHAGAAGGFLDKLYYPLCRGRIFDKTEKDEGQYDDDCDIFWATGACMMIRSETFHKMGGFDTSFFAHMEEIDLCWRFQNAGYKIRYCSASQVYHVGGGTLNYMSPFKTFLNFRNSLYTIHKNHGGYLFKVIFMRLFLDGIAGLKFIAGGQFKHFVAIIKAHGHYYKKIKSLNKLRKKKKKRKKELTGMVNVSIVWQHFALNKNKFSKLDK